MMPSKKSFSIKAIVTPECLSKAAPLRSYRGSILKWISAFAGVTRTFFFFLLLLSLSSPAHASEWAKKEGYFPRIWGKLGFGLKYVVFGWTTPWFESNEPEYNREWEGFCTGIGKGFVFEAAGLLHLVTFPIPIDIPDVGIGMHIPTKDCPLRHNPAWKPAAKDSKKDLKAVPPPNAPRLNHEKETPAAPKDPLIVEAKIPVTPSPVSESAIS